MLYTYDGDDKTTKQFKDVLGYDQVFGRCKRHQINITLPNLNLFDTDSKQKTGVGIESTWSNFNANESVRRDWGIYSDDCYISA